MPSRHVEVERIVIELLGGENRGTESKKAREMSQVVHEGEVGREGLRVTILEKKRQLVCLRANHLPPERVIAPACKMIGRPKPVDDAGESVEQGVVFREIALDNVHSAQIAEKVGKELLGSRVARAIVQQRLQNHEQGESQVDQQPIRRKKIVRIRSSRAIRLAQHRDQVEHIIAGNTTCCQEGA